MQISDIVCSDAYEFIVVYFTVGGVMSLCDEEIGNAAYIVYSCGNTVGGNNGMYGTYINVLNVFAAVVVTEPYGVFADFGEIITVNTVFGSRGYRLSVNGDKVGSVFDIF